MKLSRKIKLFVTANSLLLATVVSHAANPNFVTQIQSARVLPTPLVWVGKQEPQDAESASLLTGVNILTTNGVTAGFASFEEFLKEYPNSEWAPSLNVQMAEYYRRHGRYSLALKHWQSAWDATKGVDLPNAQLIAVRTIAGWTRLLSSLGEKDKLIRLFDEFDKLRLPLGVYGTQIEETKEALAVMKARPGFSYRCGTFALGHMAEALHMDKQLCLKFYEMQSPDGGFHMDELLQVAKTNGFDVVAVRRPADASLVVPSVVHWRLNHYAAIVAEKNGRYLVQDPTFQGAIWMDPSAIKAESSGEFILPKDKVPDSWQKLTTAECSRIYGKGLGNVFDDSEDDGPPNGCDTSGDDNDSDDSNCDPPSANDGASHGGSPPPPNCPDCGMPQWYISEPYMTLWLTDVPLRYRQSNGKWMKLRLAYKSRGEEPDYYESSFGIDWSCNWIGKLQADDSGFVTNHLTGGGMAGFDKDGTPDYKTARKLLFTGATCDGNGGEEMTVQTPTLAQNVYGASRITYSGGPTNFFLTKRLDRYGRVLQRLDYDASSGIFVINYVIDMDSKSNRLVWGHFTSTYLVTDVTNAYGQSAHFVYQPTGLSALLTQITDAQGMTTYFYYDGSDRITNMVTAYGTNSFKYYDDTDVNGNIRRAILVTEASGDHQLYAYVDNAPDSIPYPGDGYPNYRMSFHWNRKQYAAISDDWQTYGFDMPAADYKVASIKHWLHKDIGTSLGVSDTLAAAADPYDPILGTRPNCITYNYYGKAEGSAYVGTLKRVTSIKVNDQLAEEIGRNDLGRPTNFVYHTTYGLSASYTNFFDSSEEILRFEKGPRGENTRGYGYDSTITNLLISVTNAMNDVIRYTHDPTTLKVTSITFPGGMIRTNVYYDSGPYEGFLAMQADEGFRTNYFVYQNGNVYIQTNELGLVTTNLYDNLNRLVSTLYPDGTSTTNVYDKLDIVATKDRLNQWTYYGYNKVRQLLAVTNVNDEVTTYDYCGCGSPDEIIRWNGATPVTDTFDYDMDGRLTNALYADSYQLSYCYDLNNRVATVTDGDSHELELSYEMEGMQSLVATGMLGGETILYRLYDEYGRMTNSTDRNQVTTILGYDFLDRLSTRQRFGNDGASTGQEIFEYNALGLTNYYDQLSHLTTYVRDASGRVLYETNANPEVLKFTYNPADEILTLTDGKDQVTKWNYDEYGQATNKLDDNLTEVLRYKYDPLGRLTNRWSAAKWTTVFRYDPIGNLTNVDYSGGEASTPSIYYTYDDLNRLRTMQDAVGSTTFSWSDGDQLSNEDGPWANDAVSYSYSDRLRASLTVQQPNASAWTQGYGYDSMMRLSTLESPAGGSITAPSGTFSYTYSGAGDQVKKVTFPTFTSNSSLYITNFYDSLARLTNTYWVSSPLGTVDQHVYAYDQGSEVTQQVFTAGNYLNYKYDNIGQLKVAGGKGPGGLINLLYEQFGYSYDKAWNLAYRTNNTLIRKYDVNNLNELTNMTLSGVIPMVSGATTSTATNVTVNGVAAELYTNSAFATTNLTLTNGLNTLTAMARDSKGREASSSVQVDLTPGADFTYDLNGNMTSDGTRNFAYDDENQLVSVWRTNVWREDYAYDGLQRRRITRQYAWTGSSWQQTNEVHYIYDGNLVFQERADNNLPLTTYTRGTDLSGTLQGAGGSGGLLARSDKMQVIPAIVFPGNPNPQYVISSYYHSDGNGNVTSLMFPNGQSVAAYEYDPFGNMLSMSGYLARANRYRFSSKEWNQNSGLYYYGYRFYDPNVQRWPNRDPFGEYGGLNLYGYVYNDPLGMLDPYGLALFGLYDSYGDYFNDVWDTFKGEGKGAGAELSFGLYKPCYTSALQRQGGYVGTGLAMAGETLAGGAAGWKLAGDAAKVGKAADALDYSHWVPARLVPGGRRGLLDKATRALKLNGNNVSKARHYLHDPFRYPIKKAAALKQWGPKWNPLLQQLDRIPRFPAGIAAGAGAAAAGAAASQVPSSPCQ